MNFLLWRYNLFLLYRSDNLGRSSFNKTQDTEGAHINTVEAIKGVINSKDKLQVNQGIILPSGKEIEPKSRRDFDPQRDCENSLSR